MTDETFNQLNAGRYCCTSDEKYNWYSFLINISFPKHDSFIFRTKLFTILLYLYNTILTLLLHYLWIDTLKINIFKVCVSYLPNTVVNIITSRVGNWVTGTLRVNLSEYIQNKCLTFRQHSSTVPPCILLPPGFDSLNQSSILYFRQLARNKALENKMKHMNFKTKTIS